MKVIYPNMTLRYFQAWSGAIEIQTIILNAKKDEEFDTYIEELYPDGITACELNDLLRFESAEIFKYLGIK